MGAYWGRAGVAAALTPPGQDLPYQRGGFGDHLTGMSLAGGLSAALFARQRTGVGQLVSTSLLRAGMYQMGADINTSLRTGWPTLAASVRSAPNPLLTGYRCANEEWIWLLGLEGDRHWPNIAAALELDHLRDDPRFATMEGRRDHAAEVTATLQERFGSDSRAEWGRRLDAAGVWWAKVQHAHELVDDEQAHAAGGFVDVPVSDGTVGPHGGDAGGLLRPLAVHRPGDARAGPGHRADAARARLGVGAHRGAQASRRHHLTRSSRPDDAGR